MNDEVAKSMMAAARATLEEGMHKIEHCLGQLNDEQVASRPRPEMNSIANLMLHLDGNVRQWIIAGIVGAKDVRDRPAEFTDRTFRPKAELLKTLKATVAEADAILARIPAGELLANRRIQGFDLTVMDAIWSTVPHFRGHVQEIIHMTRQIVGTAYQFDFVPVGKEQGAPLE